MVDSFEYLFLVCLFLPRLGILVLTFGGWDGRELGILHTSLFIFSLGIHPPQQKFFDNSNVSLDDHMR